MVNRTALIVDDAPANRDFLERLIAQTNLRVIGAGSGQSALAAVSSLDDLTLAIVDMKLPDMTGLQLAAALRKRFPNTCLVIATMYDERSMMEAAFTNGCNVFLVKPHGFMELFRRLTANSVESLRDGPRLVIDQFGLRQFKTQEVSRVEYNPDHST